MIYRMNDLINRKSFLLAEKENEIKNFFKVEIIPTYYFEMKSDDTNLNIR